MPPRLEHTGIVRDNNDPELRGRLLIEAPEIVSGESLGWVEPRFEFVDSVNSSGSLFIPDIGATVTVTIESDEFAEVNGLDPRWVCDVYPVGTLPEEFRQNYPNRYGWVTRGGHILIFDNTENELEFYYKHSSGAEIRVTNDGVIKLTPASGQGVLVGGDAATEQLVLGNELKVLLTLMKTRYDGHTHNASVPVPGPSELFPTVDDTILSENHKVEP